MIAEINHRRIETYTISLPDVKAAVENWSLIAAAAMVGLVLMLSGVRAVMSFHAPRPGIAHVKVQPGDTVWTYARNYGDPNEYILTRVDRIEKMNKLDPSRPLQPGQELVVPMAARVVSAQANSRRIQ